MRYLLLGIAALILVPLTALAGDILLLQSNRSSAFEQMTRILQNDCAGVSMRLVLSDYIDADLARQVREEQPSVVVAIGDNALAEARKMRGTKVVYGLSLNVTEEKMPDNVSGVGTMVSPESYMKLFSALKLGRIGIIYNRKLTGAYVDRARAAAQRAGIELVALKISSAREVPQNLQELHRRKINGLWLLADTTVITPETVDSYFTFAQSLDIPVIGFSSAYLTKGALASLEVTRRETGRQICRCIRSSIHSGSSTIIDPHKGKLLFNNAVAEKLSISLPPASRLSELLADD